MSARTFFAERAFVEGRIEEGVRLTVEAGLIRGVDVRVTGRDADERLRGSLLLPGLVDLQVNGALGFALAASVGVHFGRPGVKCVRIGLF